METAQSNARGPTAAAGSLSTRAGTELALPPTWRQSLSDHKSRQRFGVGGTPAHSDCFNVLTEECLQEAQRLCRARSGEFLEIVDHVHLVVIAKLLGYLSPGLSRT